MIGYHAGELDQRITITEAAITKSATGADVQNWDAPAHAWTVWAKVDGQEGGDELFRAARDAMESWYFVRIRLLDAIRPQMRITWNDLVLDIRAIVVVDRRTRQMTLHCRVVL